MAMLSERLANLRTAGGNKAVVATEQMVGVVKDKTCGKYDEIKIYLRLSRPLSQRHILTWIQGLLAGNT